MENNGFLDFSPYGSWEALDVLKRLSEGVRTFSAIENLILRTFHFSPFLTPPLFPFDPLPLIFHPCVSPNSWACFDPCQHCRMFGHQLGSP